MGENNIAATTFDSCWCHIGVTLTVDKPGKFFCSNTSNIWCQIIYVQQASWLVPHLRNIERQNAQHCFCGECWNSLMMKRKDVPVG